MNFTDARIAAAVDELDRLAKTRDDAWQISRAEGELLHHIALASGARRIVEVGTSYGFSSLFWADAMRRTGGRVETIDRDERKVRMSRETFVAAGVDDLVTNHHGDAAEVLARLPGEIDLSFIDADKPRTQQYLDLVWPKLRAGGMVLIDNATTHAREMEPIVRSLRSRRDASSCLVEVGNGVEWAIKLGGS